MQFFAHLRPSTPMRDCLVQTVIDESYQFLTSDQPDQSIHQHFCPEMNITMCPVTESSHRLALFIYNPISRSITSLIRLPVSHARYVITGPDGEVPVQVKQNYFCFLMISKKRDPKNIQQKTKLPFLAVNFEAPSTLSSLWKLCVFDG